MSIMIRGLIVVSSLLWNGSDAFGIPRPQTIPTRLYATTEWDAYLTESSSSSTPLVARRRYHQKVQLADQRTILTSAVTNNEQLFQDTINTGDDEEEDIYGIGNMQKIQQYKEQPKKTIEQRLKQMDLQDIISTLFIPSIVLFAASRWAYNRVSTKVNDSIDNTLNAFAKEMLYYDGDFAEMKLCIDAYSKKLLPLGPARNTRMLKRYLTQYAKSKTVSPKAISSISYVFNCFKLNEVKAAQVLVSLCKELGPEKVASAGKLLFLGSRVLKSPEGLAELQPIKELIMSSYRDQQVAETLVDTSQLAMAEAAYRTAVKAGGKNQKKLTPGWEVLGLDRETAQRIFNEEAKEGFVSEREAMYGGQTQKYDKKGRHIDKEGKLANPEEAGEDDDDEEIEMSDSNVYECGNCGFTLFVAQGREDKFYGQGFKCPECGASKKTFKPRDDIEE